MQILHSASRVWAPWRNGGGRTSQILAWPPDANLNVFDWRLSTAWIEEPGPFSLFAGIDRTLVVLEGDGIRLSLNETAAVKIDSGSPPLKFSGEDRVVADLEGGPVLDLNVMVKRGAFQATVERLVVEDELVFVAAALVTFIFVCAPSILQSAQPPIALERFDAVALDRGETARFKPTNPQASIYSVTIDQCRA